MSAINVRPMPDRVYRSLESGAFFTCLETNFPRIPANTSYYGGVGLEGEPQPFHAGWAADRLFEDVSDRYEYFAGDVNGSLYHFVRPRR